MDCLILAAGYATRLYPLTKNFPKPLLEIQEGKPVINYILEKLEELEEINNVYIITNNRYNQNFIEWKNNTKTKLNLEIINDGTLNEEDKLGGIGDLNYTITYKNIEGPLLVVAGDNLFNFSLKPMYKYFKTTNNTTASLVKSDNLTDLKRGGVVSINENKKFTVFEEKPENPKSNLYSSCLYIYNKDAISKLKEYIKEEKNHDQPGRFLQWLYTRKEVYGFINQGTFIDIGTHESLERARKEFNRFC